jgi:hypothetical protein
MGAGQKRSHRLEQPVQAPAHLLGIVAGRRQIPVHVLDGRLDDVQRVPQRLELAAGHDELVLAEPDLGRSSTRLVVTLLAALTAELSRTTGTLARGQLSPAPSAPR